MQKFMGTQLTPTPTFLKTQTYFFSKGNWQKQLVKDQIQILTEKYQRTFNLFKEDENNHYKREAHLLKYNKIEIAQPILSQEKQKLTHLLQIEVELKEAAKKTGQLAEEQHLYGLKNFQENKPYKHHKLFSNFVRSWMKENNFNELIKSDKFFTENEFFQIIKEKNFIKDNFASLIGHGEWTHIIQWMILANANKNSNYTLFGKDISLFYQSFAGDNGDVNRICWFVTFENNSVSMNDPDNFCSVENLNRFLVESDEAKEKLPILHQLIRSRAIKREEEYQVPPMVKI